MPFELASSYEPRGDQGQAIEELTRSLVSGNRHQTLLGVTGSGKTFTIANVIREIIIIAGIKNSDLLNIKPNLGISYEKN